MLAGKTNISFEFLYRSKELFPILNANFMIMDSRDKFTDESIRPKGHRSQPP